MNSAVVIGATGNLGAALVASLGKSGYQLDERWLSSERPDVRSREAFRDLPPRVDLAVYLPGINVVKPFVSMSDDEWTDVLETNLGGAFRFARAVYPSLLASSAPQLVFVSSIMVTHPYPQRAPYAASKGGLEALARSLAVEWGHFCTTYALRLGHLTGLMKSTQTSAGLLDQVKRHVPSEQLVNPQDIAQFVLTCHKADARYLNGSIIDMDHGYTINRWPL